ncbi:MAG TPA: STAS/SEC14 domain-containing protein [Labilithrix sp.]|jgi:hypothetical protein|nr:STAS/SEC14 domain-containing protein [Labilithrix sp.]
MSEHIRIGRHELWREPDTGFICLLNDGTVDEQHATAMLEAMTTLAGELAPDEPVYVLTDNRKAAGFTSGARKIFATGNGARNKAYVAIFGVSALVGASLKLLLKAISAISSAPTKVEISADEAQARAWLSAQRRLNSAQVGKT